MLCIIWELLPEWIRGKYTPDKEAIKEMIRLRKKSILLTAAAVFAAAVMAAEPAAAKENAPELPGLVFESQMELEYAQCFDVFYYEGGYELLDIHESGRYLLVPEDGQVPEGLDESIVVLQKPLDLQKKNLHQELKVPLRLYGKFMPDLQYLKLFY